MMTLVVVAVPLLNMVILSFMIAVLLVSRLLYAMSLVLIASKRPRRGGLSLWASSSLKSATRAPP